MWLFFKNVIWGQQFHLEIQCVHHWTAAALDTALATRHMHHTSVCGGETRPALKVRRLKRSSIVSAIHNCNQKRGLINPFVVLLCGAREPLLIPASPQEDHDFWDAAASREVAPGTCWKWLLRKADGSTGIVIRHFRDSEGIPWASLCEGFVSSRAIWRL